MLLRFDMRRMALLSLSAALFLSGLIFMPHAQHVFWAPEAFAARLLAPLPLLFLMAEGKGSAPAGSGLASNTGLGLLYLLIGWWFLSAGLAFRLDLALRELAAWLAAPLILAAAWRLAEDGDSRRRIVFMILAAGLLQALYGIVQSAGLEPALASAIGPRAFGFEALNWAVTYGGRAGAFLGNPNFLGGQLALLLPLAVALAMDGRGSRLHRAWRWGAAAVLAAGLVVTQTRGAWLGAALGLALLLWICRTRLPGLLTRNRAGLGLLSGAGLLALGLFFATHAQNLSRITGIFHGDEELSRRFILMGCALKLASQHMLAGVGPGNLRIFFPAVQALGLSHEQLLSRPYIVTEHAHNDFVQMAADSGLPALLLLLALIAWAFATLWRALGKGTEVIRDSEGASDKLLLAGIISGLAALQLHALANFPFLITPTQMSAWALAALGLRLASPPQPEAQPEGQATARLWRRWALGGSLALYLFNTYDAGRMLMKDALWWVAEGEENQAHSDRAEGLLFKTLELDRMEDRLWMLHGKAQLEKNFTINSTGSFKEAIRLNPHFHEARVMLGRAYVGIGKYAEAEETLAVVAQEAPNLVELWDPLAAALYMQGKYQEAVTAYDWAIYFHAATAQMLENKAAALGSLGRYTEALITLDNAEAMDPHRAKNYVNRAITHIKMGQKSLAKFELQEAARRDPLDTQVKDLMKVLK